MSERWKGRGGKFEQDVDAALARQKEAKNVRKEKPVLLKAADVIRAARKSGNPGAYLSARAADPAVREVYKQWRSTTRMGKFPWNPDE